VTLHLEVQRIHAHLAAVVFGDLEGLRAQPAPAVARSDKELVDEGLPPAVLEAEAQRHGDIADDRVAVARHPEAAEVWILDERERSGAGLRFHERIAVLLVIAAHHREDRVDVARFSQPKMVHSLNLACCAAGVSLRTVDQSEAVGARWLRNEETP